MTKNLEESNVGNISIPLEFIYVQKNILNRDMKRESLSCELLDLVKSIREVDLIHPIIVRADNTGRYELFVGQRCLEAYKMLLAEDPEKYKCIPSRVYSNTISTSDMLLKTLYENHFRKDLKKSEDTEFILSFIPVYLELEKLSNDNNTKNMIFGFKIMKKFNSYIRSTGNKEKHEKYLQSLTGYHDIIKRLNYFFDKIGRSPELFFLSSRVYFTCTSKIIHLFRKGKVINRNALRLQAMKSKEDREKIISRLLDGEHFTGKQLANFISESNAKFSPVKKSNKLIQKIEHVLTQLRSDKKATQTDKENDEIKMYLENIINKRRQ